MNAFHRKKNNALLRLALPILAIAVIVFLGFSFQLSSFNPEAEESSGEPIPKVIDPISVAPNGWKPPNTKDLSLETLVPGLKSRPRKFFLDCGANTGSTYKLFHEIWPNPEEYHMISFEIDPLLAPYYAGFVNHTALVPLGVSNEQGSFTAYLDLPWEPKKSPLWNPFQYMTRDSKRRKKVAKSKWGGGSLFSFSTSGGEEYRGLKRTVQVPTFDLSKFISDNFQESDEVILKIDIEGAEYSVIDKMLKDGSFRFVDKFFLEFHDWQPSGWTKEEKDNLRARMIHAGVTYDQWDAEYPKVTGLTEWDPKILGELQSVRSKLCRTKGFEGKIKLVLAVGMSKSKAVRLVESVLAHGSTANINIGIFFYRDFIEDNPELVSKWSKNPRLILGIRGDSPKPPEYLKKHSYSFGIRNIILSSLRHLVKATGFSTVWYLQDYDGSKALSEELQTLKLNVLKNNVWVPPKDLSGMEAAFFEQRTVEQIPPLLAITHSALIQKTKKSKTWLVLDSDFEETWISSVFLLDYLASPKAIEENLIVESFLNC